MVNGNALRQTFAFRIAFRTISRCLFKKTKALEKVCTRTVTPRLNWLLRLSLHFDGILCPSLKRRYVLFYLYILYSTSDVLRRSLLELPWQGTMPTDNKEPVIHFPEIIHPNCRWSEGVKGWDRWITESLDVYLCLLYSKMRVLANLVDNDNLTLHFSIFYTLFFFESWRYKLRRVSIPSCFNKDEFKYLRHAFGYSTYKIQRKEEVCAKLWSQCLFEVNFT